jgi:hypothetical protein
VQATKGNDCVESEQQKLAAHGLVSIQRQMCRLSWKVTATEKQQDAKEDLENFVHCNLESRVHLVQILFTFDTLSILMLIMLHCSE